jgi:hypothetical protein
MSDLWNYNDGEDSDLSDSQGMKSTVDNNVVGSCVGREEGDICIKVDAVLQYLFNCYRFRPSRR